MKKTALCLCLLAGCQPALAAVVDWDVSGKSRQRHAIEWYQADTVPLAYALTDADAPLDLTTWSQVVWQVVSATNLNQRWVSSTGTVSATNQVAFELAPEQSNLQPGRYVGFVRGIAGDPIESQRLLVAQGIVVNYAPDGSEIPLSGPLSYYVADAIASNAAAIVSNAEAIQGILDALDDYLTEAAAAGIYQPIGDYATQADLSAAVAPLATTQALAAVAATIPSLVGYATTTDLATAVAPLATTQQLAASTSALVSTSELAAAVAPLATTQQLAAVEASIPSVAGLATTGDVAAAIAAIPEVDLAPYATTQALAAVEASIPSIDGLATTGDVAAAIAAIPEVDLAPYATTQALAAVEAAIPSIAGLATTGDVAAAIAAIPETDLTPYATTQALAAVEAAIPSIAGLASTGDVAAAIAAIPETDLTPYATTQALAAVEAAIPSIAGLATTGDVAAAIAAIPETDLTPYATTQALAAVEAAIPSIAGLASTGDVAAAIAAIPETDLTPYATTQALAAAVAPLATTQALASAVAPLVPTNFGGNIRLSGGVVIGSTNSVAAARSLVVGNHSSASGMYALAVGQLSDARGNSSFAQGNLATATGLYSRAMGSVVSAQGLNSFAAGYYAAALHDHSFIWHSPTGSVGTSFSTRGPGTFNVKADGGIYLYGPLYLSDTNFADFFSVSTSGVVQAKAFRKIVGNSTNDIVSTVDLAAAIAPLATTQALAAAVAPLATTQALAAAVAPLATTQALAAAVAPLATTQGLAAAVAPLASTSHVATALSAYMSKIFSGAVNVFSTNSGYYNFVGGALRINGSLPMSRSSETAYPIRPFADWSTKTYNAGIRTGVLEDNHSNMVWRLSFVGAWDSTNNLVVLEQSTDFAILEQIGAYEDDLWLGLSSVQVDHDNDAEHQGFGVSLLIDSTNTIHMPWGTTNSTWLLTDPVAEIKMQSYGVPSPGLEENPAPRIARIIPRHFTDASLVGSVFETRGIDLHVDHPATPDSAANARYADSAAAAAAAGTLTEIRKRTAETNLDRFGLRFGPRWLSREIADSLFWFYGGNPVLQGVPGGAVIPRITSQYIGDETVTLAVSAPTNGLYQVNWSTNLMDWATIDTNAINQLVLDDATVGLTFTNPAPAADSILWSIVAIESPGGAPILRTMVDLVHGTNDAPYALQSWVEDYIATHAATDSVANAWFRGDEVTNAVDSVARANQAKTNASDIVVMLAPAFYETAGVSAEEHLEGIDTALGAVAGGATNLNFALAPAITSATYNAETRTITIMGPALDGSTPEAETAEGAPQELELADGYLTLWSTGNWEQAYSAAGAATVRVVKVNADKPAAIIFHAAISNHSTLFLTNNLLGWTATGLATNGDYSTISLRSKPGSTNWTWSIDLP